MKFTSWKKKLTMLGMSMIGLAGFNVTLADTIHLTGATIYDISGSNQYIGHGFDTTGGNGVYNLYLLSSSNTLFNSGNGATTSLNLNISTPGTYVFGVRGDGGGFNWPTPYAGLNLFFNSNPAAGISARTNYNAINPDVVPFANNGLGLSGNLVRGANNLVFTSGNLRASLSNFTFMDYRNVGGSNMVSPLNSVPNGLNDYTGQITLRVTSVVPEPAEWATMLGGLMLITAMARRRKNALH